MRRIRVTTPTFVGPAISYVADDADDLTSQSYEANELGSCALLADGSALYMLTDTDTPAWTQMPFGFATAPADVGTEAAAGSAATAVRGDHVHDHGQQTDDTLHAAASAAAAGFMTEAMYLSSVGVGMQAAVTVPAGSGTKAIVTTSALLTVENTSRTGRVVIVWNKALDQAETRSGEIEFAVAWHDDDTQTIEQSNVSDNSDSGATPSITVAVHGVNVVLLLNADHTVTVSLTRDGTYARQCKARYFVEETLGQTVVPATFQSGTSNADGSEIALTFDIALDETSVPAAEAFTLHGTTATVASVGISTTTVTLTLTGNVAYSETVTWDYAVPEENPLLADGDGGPVAALTGEDCTNAVPPAYSSGTTNAAGSEITLTWAGLLNEESTPDTGDWTINGDDATVDSVTVTGATVVLGLSGAIENGDSITVDFAQGTNKLQSAEGHNVANLSGAAVTNIVPPLYSSSTSNNAGSEIVLTYEGALNEANVPAPGDYTLAGTSATVQSVGVSGTDVTLTLTTALVEYGESPTVSYTSGSTPLQGAAGQNCANLTTEAVTNITPPDFVSATTDADGDAIVATFEGNLDAGSEPAIGAFSLSGTSAALDSVTGISGTDVTLALDSSVLFAETLLLGYTKPGENPLRENTTEYECVDFSEAAVTNITPPVLSSLTTNALGTQIVMTYSAALDEASIPAPTDFAIGGDDATVSSVWISGTTVTLSLDGAIEYGDSPTVDYTAGTNKIRSDVGNLNVADLSSEACTNAVPPGYSAGATDAVDGSEITLTWAGNLNESSTPAASCFDINGDDATVASLVVSGATVVLTLSGNVENGDTITVDYVKPGSNPLQSAEGYDLAPLTAAAVTNNVPA